MKKQNLDLSIDKLRHNPVFCLSLGNKELFHSNFWAYLLTDFGAPLPAVRAFFGIPKSADIKVLREKKHFDLLIYWNVGNEYSCLVIENKVKSLPNAAQLKKYAEDVAKDIRETLNLKRNDSIAQIRLAVVAPERLIQEIKQGSSGTSGMAWESLPYEDLAKAIKKDLADVEDCHKQWLLESYVDFLKELFKILNTIEIDEETSFFTPKATLDVLEEIRIHDVYEKVWFSILKDKMRSVLKPTPGELYHIDYTNGARLDYAFTRDETPSPSGKIFVLQFQRGKFCIGVNPVPENKEKCFYKIIEKIFNELGFGKTVPTQTRGGKKLLMQHFGDFRYRYVKIAGESFESVAKKAKKAIAKMKAYKEEILDKLEKMESEKQASAGK